MAPAHIPLFLSQKSSTKYGIMRPCTGGAAAPTALGGAAGYRGAGQRAGVGGAGAGAADGTG